MITKIDRYNSGGNVMIYYGKLDNGKYFVFDMDSLSILDTDYAETLTDEFYAETDGDTFDWDAKHVIKTYYISEKYNCKDWINDLVTEIRNYFPADFIKKKTNGKIFLETFTESSITIDDGEFVGVELGDNIVMFNKTWWESTFN